MRSELKSWGLLLFLACVWGSSFILMKKGMYTTSGEAIFSDTQVGTLRMLIASLVILPFALRTLKKIETKREIFNLCVVGFCGNFFPAFLFTYAETGISSGYAGMLNSFTPIFTMILGVLLFKNKLSLLQIIGMIIGSVGIVLLLGIGRAEAHEHVVSFFHVGAIILATLFYGISLNFMKYTLQKFNAIEITSLAFMMILLPSIFGFFKFEVLNTIQHNEHAFEGLGFISILAIVGTAFAVILYSKVIAMTTTMFASTVTYIIPIVAVLIGLYFKEKIFPYQINAMLVVLTGVCIANYGHLFFKRERLK
jgi:drug/metabolite transporter (DMT)-like permease